MAAKKYNPVTCFMYYINNRFTLSEAISLFGKDLGTHIYNKKMEVSQWSNDVTLTWYAELDTACKDKLVLRAQQIYNKTKVTV